MVVLYFRTLLKGWKMSVCSLRVARAWTPAPCPAHRSRGISGAVGPRTSQARTLPSNLLLEKWNRLQCLKAHILHCPDFLPNPLTSPKRTLKVRNQKTHSSQTDVGWKMLLEHIPEFGLGLLKCRGPGTASGSHCACVFANWWKN